MASSSSGSSIAAPEAVQVLVSLLADESPNVREASIASLKDIAALNPVLVLDCFSAISRGGRRRFGNMAGLFQVMAYGVRALDKNDVEPSFMTKLAKIATAEIISSKELNADWQRAASGLLVSIGLHLPDLALDAPWPIIQANAIYFSSCMLSVSDDQHILTLYYPQVFGTLVGKMSKSEDASVRATCSSALGLLLKSSKSISWKAA